MDRSDGFYFVGGHVIEMVRKLQAKVEGQRAGGSDTFIDGGSVDSGGELHVRAIFWAVVEGKGEVDVDVCPKRIQYGLWFKVVEVKNSLTDLCCDVLRLLEGRAGGIWHFLRDKIDDVGDGVITVGKVIRIRLEGVEATTFLPHGRRDGCHHHDGERVIVATDFHGLHA